MTNEIAVHQGSGLDITREQDQFNDRQLAALRQLGLQDATNADLAVFLHVSQRTGLDPFARQIYMIKRFTKDGPRQTIQTGIDGFRLVARRAADRSHEHIAYEDTLWANRDREWFDAWYWDEPPVAAKVVVLRGGKPYPAIAHYREYVQTKKDGDPTQMWADKPALMLAKCAEALALRKAFPQDLAGLHTGDEYRDDNPPQTVAQRRVTARQIKGEAEPVPEGVDPVTGEVVGETYADPNAPLGEEPPGWDVKTDTPK